MRAISYFRGDPDGSAFVGIWRQYGDREFILKHRIELPPANVGFHTVPVDPPLHVERGDFLGVHYSVHSTRGVVVVATEDDPVIPMSELYQSLSMEVYDEDLETGRTLRLDGYPGTLERITFGLKAVVESGTSVTGTTGEESKY